MPLLASSLLCQKVKVDPFCRLRCLQRGHPWAEEAMTGAFLARPSKEEVTFRGFEETLHFGQRDPNCTCISADSSLAFLYPHGLSLERPKSGKSSHTLDVQKDSKGREEGGEDPGALALP